MNNEFEKTKNWLEGFYKREFTEQQVKDAANRLRIFVDLLLEANERENINAS